MLFVIAGLLGRPGPRAAPSGLVKPVVVAWDPMGRPMREADTLFLPDLTSPATLNAGGGFLNGPEDKTQAQLIPDYEFGAGRFGPGVRARPGLGDYVFYPVDGLLDGQEFTLEFWTRADQPWSAMPTLKATFAVIGDIAGNTLEILSVNNGQCSVYAQSRSIVPRDADSRSWQKPCDALGLTAGVWHQVALTLKSNVIRVYIDGVVQGEIDGVRFQPIWSDSTRGEGFQLGGEARDAGGVWVSDVRSSLTARVPGKPIILRSLQPMVSIDVGGRSESSLPAGFLGAVAVDPIASRDEMQKALQVARVAKLLTVTPIKPGSTDADHPASGASGRFSYDWQVVDRTFDVLRKQGLLAYADIDSTPQLLGGSVAPFVHGGTSGNNLDADVSLSSGFSPQVPTNMADWSAMVADLVNHVENERHYAVKQWTIWNEPELSYQGGLSGYLDLYAASATAVRSVNPRARVGGPETASTDGKFIQALFQRTKRDNLPLDFVSYHEYSGDVANIDRGRALVDYYATESGFATPFPISIGEFNWNQANLYRVGVARFNQSPWNVRALGAAYTTAAITRMLNLGGFRQFTYFTTVYGTNLGEFDLSSDQLLGYPTPVQWAPFNALTGLKRTLGDQLLPLDGSLAPGVYGIATRDSRTGKLGVVLANYGWAQRQTRQISVRLANLGGSRRWHLTQSLVDRQHSSRYDLAQELPAGAAQNELQAVEVGTMKVNRSLTLQLVLPQWSSTFIELTPENGR